MVVNDLLGNLKKLIEWQRVVQAADKVPELERRIAALEAKMPAAPKYQTCPSCGVGRWHAKSSRPDEDFGDMGVTIKTYGCTNCSFTDTK